MSVHEHKISMLAAIFINLNVMLGAGLFMNTTLVAQSAGALGVLGYLTVGVLLLPLVVSIAYLIRLHPSGGFYTYASQEIHPFAGFLSAWAYFIGKLASSGIVIHTAMRLVQQVIPAAATIDTIILDLVVLSLFIGLNMLNLRTGSIIQSFFLGFKLIPIFFAIFAGLYLLNPGNLSGAHLVWEGVPGILPLVLYATIGFEAACSLSSKIKDAQKNASKVILISYGLVIAIVCSYQLMFYGALGSLFAHFSSYLNAFPTLTNLVFNNPTVANNAASFMHLAIAASALGGGYGILFSNCWNLYTLAEHKHTIKPHWFTQLNRHFIPWLCVLAEGVICALYLLLTFGNQVPLQQISALGSVIAYTLSACALLAAKKNDKVNEIKWIVPVLGLVSCLLLITSCVYGLITKGFVPFIAFAIMLALGSVMFWTAQGSKRHKNHHEEMVP